MGKTDLLCLSKSFSNARMKSDADVSFVHRCNFGALLNDVRDYKRLSTLYFLVCGHFSALGQSSGAGFIECAIPSIVLNILNVFQNGYSGFSAVAGYTKISHVIDLFFVAQ